MAEYAIVDPRLWSDPDVQEFTPEDRYGFVWCMTNPHINISGCYEVSIKQIAWELGYAEDTTLNLLKRLDKVHDVIRYDGVTKELLVINWHKHHWHSSEKANRALLAWIQRVKSDSFRTYLADLYNARPTVEEPYDPDTGKKPKKKPEDPRHKYGEYGWVKLSDAEYQRLLKDLGPEELERCIRYVDESAQSNSNRNKWTDWNLVVRKCHRDNWGIRPEFPGRGSTGFQTSNPFMEIREERTGQQ